MDVLGLTWQPDSPTAPSSFLPLLSQVLIPRALPNITPAREPPSQSQLPGDPACDMGEPDTLLHALQVHVHLLL